MKSQDALSQLIKFQKQLDRMNTPTYIRNLESLKKQELLIQHLFGNYAQYETMARQFEDAYRIYKSHMPKDTYALRTAIKVCNSSNILDFWRNSAKFIDWENASKENLHKDDIDEYLETSTLLTPNTSNPENDSLTQTSSNSTAAKSTMDKVHDISTLFSMAERFHRLIKYTTSQEAKDDIVAIYDFFRDSIETIKDFFDQ